MKTRLTHNPLITRRTALRGSAYGLALASLAGCGGGDDASATTTSGSTSTATTGTTATGTTATTTTTTTTTSGTASCVLIPQETDGPYPLYDPILSNTAYVRQDITEGRAGVPLRLAITLTNVNDACRPLTGTELYIWHCDKDGLYSGYNQPGGNTVGQTFLRGLQTTDANGKVAFTTIFPGWYAGRITHIHLRAYVGAAARATTQFAFPSDIVAAVYASALYTKGPNTSVSGFAQDGIFADGTTYQMLAMSGSVATGYDASINVGIAL